MPAPKTRGFGGRCRRSRPPANGGRASDGGPGDGGAGAGARVRAAVEVGGGARRLGGGAQGRLPPAQPACLALPPWQWRARRRPGRSCGVRSGIGGVRRGILSRGILPGERPERPERRHHGGYKQPRLRRARLPSSELRRRRRRRCRHSGALQRPLCGRSSPSRPGRITRRLRDRRMGAAAGRGPAAGGGRIRAGTAGPRRRSRDLARGGCHLQWRRWDCTNSAKRGPGSPSRRNAGRVGPAAAAVVAAAATCRRHRGSHSRRGVLPAATHPRALPGPARRSRHRAGARRRSCLGPERHRRARQEVQKEREKTRHGARGIERDVAGQCTINLSGFANKFDQICHKWGQIRLGLGPLGIRVRLRRLGRRIRVRGTGRARAEQQSRGVAAAAAARPSTAGRRQERPAAAGGRGTARAGVGWRAAPRSGPGVRARDLVPRLGVIAGGPRRGCARVSGLDSELRRASAPNPPNPPVTERCSWPVVTMKVRDNNRKDASSTS